MLQKQKAFIGVDVGTQGVRCIVVDTTGNILASTKEDFPLNEASRVEQSPNDWWEGTLRCLKKLAKQLDQIPGQINLIQAITVTSTSGTVIPLNEDFEPIYNALMYSDNRSDQEADLCSNIAHSKNHEGYKAFNSSCGLPKIVWFTHTYPDKTENIKIWSHAADFILGKLSGNWGVTDFTNALKTGYDLVNKEWPHYIFNELQIPKEWLPTVLASGVPLGKILPEISYQTGLPTSIIVTTGITDGCASQIASGATHPNSWNTTIGTTLVVKGVTKKPIIDPKGRLYNHRHPDGIWMPGGASNTGADWITREYKKAKLDWLNNEASKMIPTKFLAYPLSHLGERFPFISKTAHGFQPQGLSNIEIYTAKMEGVAYIERLTYELIEQLSEEKINTIYTAGGASDSDVWLKIRSNVLNKPIIKMKYTSGAFGAAILSASRTVFSNLQETSEFLIQTEKIVEPSVLSGPYEENYYSFIEKLKELGFITARSGSIG